MGTQEEYNDVTLYKNGDDTVIDADFAVIGKFDEASGLIGQVRRKPMNSKKMNSQKLNSAIMKTSLTLSK